MNCGFCHYTNDESLSVRHNLGGNGIGVLSLLVNIVIFRRWYYDFNECILAMAPMTFRNPAV